MWLQDKLDSELLGNLYPETEEYANRDPERAPQADPA
jgi:hypothetical protein